MKKIEEYNGWTIKKSNGFLSRIFNNGMKFSATNPKYPNGNISASSIEQLRVAIDALSQSIKEQDNG